MTKMSALEELEKIAVRHAQEAVELDREGKKEQAIAAYKRAIDCLLKLVHAYPDHNLSRFFIQRAQIYKTRIRVLQDIWVDSRSSEENVASYGAEQKAQIEKIEEMILREPPNVHWDEIIGLEDAKKAIKETVAVSYTHLTLPTN